MSRNKIVISLILIAGICGILIFVGKRAPLEKVKKQLLLTEKIKVEKIPIESDDPIFCPTIQDEESI